MLDRQILVFLALQAEQTLKNWLFQLGGLGFIPLGVLDNSVIPLPGSIDLLTLYLSASKEKFWLYYALMATLGSVIGGFLTYRLARKGGKEALERRFPKKKLESVYKAFERWGWGAVAIPAILPPPLPIVPFLLAAGAMQYPVRKFLFALSLGRAIRYTLLAYLAGRYGGQIIHFISQHAHPALFAGIGLAAVVIVIVLYFVLGKRQKSRKK
jgi:membrane protein YqaA with SNARE-associated domain